MRILFLTDNFPPEVNAPATRTYEHCREWVKNGVEVTVVTCVPNFPKGKVYSGYKNKPVQKDHIDGIIVYRVWSYITANSGFFKRVLDFLSFSISSFLFLLFSRKQYDIIIATSPQFFTGLTAMLISKAKRIPWIFEVRDLWPEGIIILSRRSKTYKLLEWLEGKYYKSSSGIVTVTESFKLDILKRFSLSEKKIRIIYNGSNNRLFNKIEKDESLIEQLGLKDQFIIGYAGTLGISHSLDFVVSCIPEIDKKRTGIHFLFIGSGAMEKKLKDIIKDNKIKNISILPPVQKELVRNYISIFDIGLVPLKSDPAYFKVIPSKIFELAAMKKPILLGVNGESKSIIEEYNAGVSFIPESRSDFVKKVIYLYDHKDELNTFHPGLSKMSQDFDRGTLAKKMLAFINKIVSENTNNK